jgi:predicted nucleotide-binding protein (sugar kinase/HSP70/actin superfamily)
MYWRYGQRILAAARFIRRTPGLHAVYLTNFGCGPDSFIAHFFREAMAGEPYLQIEVDEHSADAGVITRIEAFLDGVAARQEASGRTDLVGVASGSAPDRGQSLDTERPAATGGNGKRIRPAVRPRVHVPAMCDHTRAFAATLRGCGVDAVAMPETTAASARTGRELTSGKECYPCALTIGDIVTRIRSPEFERGRDGFYMPTASGPCRFGQYHRFQRLVLDRLGYQDVPLFTADARTSYRSFDFLADAGRFRRLCWLGLVATDVLYRLRCRTRPYEREAGQVEACYQEGLAALERNLEHEGDLESLAALLSERAARFAQLADLSGPRKPLVGVVGEIYLRQNRYGNDDLIRRLEDLGAEASLSPMAEWILYTSYTYRRRLRRERQLLELGRAALREIYQTRTQGRLYQAARFHVDLPHDLPTGRLLALAAPYLHESILGEAILSISKAIEFYREGAAGIVNALPFGCMPGTVVTAVSRRLRRDCRGLPWLNLAYEGLAGAGDHTRLEAFVYQAARFRAATAGKAMAAAE